MSRLADTVPAAVVVLIALGFVTWLAGKALSILDRTVNKEKDDDVSR